MVQLMKSMNRRGENKVSPNPPPAVKAEIHEDEEEEEDFLEDQHAPYLKRSKPSPSSLHHHHQLGTGTANAFSIPPSQYNPLDEPSPLGLRLRKSPSLLDLIQMKLSQSQGAGAVPDENCSSGHKKEAKGGLGTSSIDKLKASNFTASFLKIGTWEYVSRYEGDLVAKCYFAKHKLVWEVLEGGLKSKIEIQWSDIMGLTANIPDNGPGTLKVVLARQPLFFRETNPQPRKHTLWQATADFTDGQASTNRLHFLQCPQGLINKHFEKLIQCDMRLNFLSQQPEVALESPYFEPRASIFAESNESTTHDFDQVKFRLGATNSGYHDIASPHTTSSTSLMIEHPSPITTLRVSQSQHIPREAPSPSSVIDSCVIDANGRVEVHDPKQEKTMNWERLKVPGLHSSMSVSDLVNHIGHCISEQKTSHNPTHGEGLEYQQEALEDIAQYLLSDSQFTSASDEKSIMSRVNSLCCLLQKDAPSTTQNPQVDGGAMQHYAPESVQNNQIRSHNVALEGDLKQHAPAMSRKDSFGDLLLQLPRITSLPKFLFNISEDG